MNRYPWMVAFGEALVDLIERPDGLYRPCLGGSVSNFARALALQGAPVCYLNPLSTDKFGDDFAKLLQTSGVVLACQRRSTAPTALALVSLDSDGAPTYSFHRGKVADRDLDADGLAAHLPHPLQLVHTGGLALVPEDLERSRAVMEHAAARGALLSVDANMRPLATDRSDDYAAGVWRALRGAHIVKVSDEDLVHLGLEGVSVERMHAALFDGTATELVAITRGAQGASLLTRRTQVELPAPPELQVADTVGAGDCFHAGLLASLRHMDCLGSGAALAALDARTLLAALKHAMSAASINITHTGCTPPTWEETAAFGRSVSAWKHA
jgi:fructokinase